jgi:hypothetical protein
LLKGNLRKNRNHALASREDPRQVEKIVEMLEKAVGNT